MTQVNVLRGWGSEAPGVVAHETVGDIIAVEVILRALEIGFQGRIREIDGTDSAHFELANAGLEGAGLR